MLHAMQIVILPNNSMFLSAFSQKINITNQYFYSGISKTKETKFPLVDILLSFVQSNHLIA